MSSQNEPNINNCNIFKTVSVAERKAAFTQKLAELINQLEHSKNN